MIRIGIGNDTHRLIVGRPLIIGGVNVPYEFGAEGHSDSDVLAHAVIDAVLGALAEGDIGVHFPDSDAQWKDANSFKMLADVMGGNEVWCARSRQHICGAMGAPTRDRSVADVLYRRGRGRCHLGRYTRSAQSKIWIA